MDLRDYYYLDKTKLEHYLSSLDEGSLESIRQTYSDSYKAAAQAPEFKDPESGVSAPRSERLTEQTLNVSAFNAFSRLYDSISDDLIVIEDTAGVDLSVVKRGKIIEISRPLEKSPITDMLDQLFQLADMMQNLPGAENTIDPETANNISAMTLLFRGGNIEERRVPLVARPGDDDTSTDASLLVVTQMNHVIRGVDDLEGDRTVLGKVSRIIPESSKLSLIDQMTSIPRSLRRSKGGPQGLQSAIVGLFEAWPDELGGAISESQLELSGPVVIVEPLAIYS